MRSPDAAPGGGAAPAALPDLPSGWRWAREGTVPLLRAGAFDALDVIHAFTTRIGGVSEPPFDTLNLGRAAGDAARAVRENRRRAMAALGRGFEEHVEASQVHGARAAVVGVRDRGRKIPGVDILLTRDPGVVLAMHYADCVPVLLVDPGRRAVAAVHTGWRGTAAGAAAEAVRALARAFGSRPGDLVAAIGPAIGPCCYEVDAPVTAALAPWPWRDAVLEPAGEGRWRLDLWEANRRQLADAGVPAGAVGVAGVCTACRPGLFFSHRRDRRTGRMGALVALR
jgi:YfiH family protein